jgi:hypothetical protein
MTRKIENKARFQNLINIMLVLILERIYTINDCDVYIYL